MIPVNFEFHRAEAVAGEKDVVTIHGVLCGARTTFRMSRQDALAMAGKLEDACQGDPGDDERRSTGVR